MRRTTKWNDPWERTPRRPAPSTLQDDRWQPRPSQEEPTPPPQEEPSEQTSLTDEMPPPYVYPDLSKKKSRGSLVRRTLSLLVSLCLIIFFGIQLFTDILSSGEISFDDDGFTFEWGEEDEDSSDEEENRSTTEQSSTSTDEEAAFCYLDTAEPNPDISIQVISWADMEELSYEEVYAQNISSVVSVVCYITNTTGSTGTGIIVHRDGYIVTNAHVIEDAYECYVILEDGNYYAASLVGADEESDLAVLKIDVPSLSGLTAARFGDSDELVVGNACVAIGDPLGIDFRGTMTTGIISALNRNVEVNGYDMTLIQTDCAINSGNSGGPLINMYGLVVGICNMKMMSTATTVEGLGFAIPSNTIKTVVNKLIATGEVQKAMLGITAQTLTTAQCREYGVSCGILVYSVSENSDAYAQGIQAGDIIVAAEGVDITSVDQLNNLKADMYPGDCITLTIYRDGVYTDYLVRLHSESDVY